MRKENLSARRRNIPVFLIYASSEKTWKFLVRNTKTTWKTISSWRFLTSVQRTACRNIWQIHWLDSFERHSMLMNDAYRMEKKEEKFPDMKMARIFIISEAGESVSRKVCNSRENDQRTTQAPASDTVLTLPLFCRYASGISMVL